MLSLCMFLQYALHNIFVRRWLNILHLQILYFRVTLNICILLNVAIYLKKVKCFDSKVWPYVSWVQDLPLLCGHWKYTDTEVYHLLCQNTWQLMWKQHKKSFVYPVFELWSLMIIMPFYTLSTNSYNKLDNVYTSFKVNKGGKSPILEVMRQII